MFSRLFIICFISSMLFASVSYASGILSKEKISFERAQKALEPHKAIYDINLIATRSGSPIINISGKMFYEWKPSCEGWITNHRFNLFYEYADGPGLTITSDFSTYESFDEEEFTFLAQRKRNDELYQEFRGAADRNDDVRKAIFSIPEDVSFDLSENTNFPMRHTVKMIQHMLNNDKFFNAIVFDGSDDEGPVEINAFIGKETKPEKELLKNTAIDEDLLKPKAKNIRMAVFPVESENAVSDYEMSIVFHSNGVISDMEVDYDDFSVSQQLIALEKIVPISCN